jgi:hypothetical protein
VNKVSVAEVKRYLGLDGGEQDALLAVLIASAEHTVEKVLRDKITAQSPEIVKATILFIVWQLYFHRDGGEIKVSDLEGTVAVMLSDLRKPQF